MILRGTGIGRRRIAPVIASILLTCVARAADQVTERRPEDTPLDVRLLAIGGEGFRLRETEHFAICYDTDYSVVRALTGRLEGTYDAMQRFCGAYRLDVSAPDDRLGVLLFGDYEAYSEYVRAADLDPRSIAGFYSQQTNLAVFCDVATSPSLRAVTTEIARLQKRLDAMSAGPKRRRDRNQRRQAISKALTANRARRDHFVRRFNRFVIQHEAVHQVLFNIGVHQRGAANPTWLVEGLACQFEVPQTDGQGFIRNINHMRLADFRDALDSGSVVGAAGDRAREDAFSSGRLVPLRSFIGEDETFRAAGEQIVSRYAQAWSLVHYLARERGDAFSTYLRSIAGREPGVIVSSDDEIAVFDAAFGPPDEQFQASWLSYIQALRLDLTAAGR